MTRVLMLALFLAVFRGIPATAGEPGTSASVSASQDKTHPEFLRLERDLLRQQKDADERRLSPEQYRDWALQFGALLDATLVRVPPSLDNVAAHARIKAMLGERDQAGAALNKALEQNPGSAILLRTKGRILYEQNDFSGAAELGLRAWENSGRTDRVALELYQASKGRAAPTKTVVVATMGVNHALAPAIEQTPLPRAQLPRSFRAFSEPPPSPASEPSNSPRRAAAPLPAAVNEVVSVSPAAVVLSGPRVIARAYRGSDADAQIWTATYSDGAKFEILAPNSPSPLLIFHTVSQAAEAARYLPTNSRAVVKQIVLSPVVNPDDAYWSTTYKQPNFQSYMTAGAAGIIRIYPNSANGALPSDNYMRGTLIHETGHTWANRLWGSDRSKGKWAEWRAAMVADRTVISEYAKSSINEDFAETFQAYWSSKGTPKFLQYKAAFPNRFAMLDKEVK